MGAMLVGKKKFRKQAICDCSGPNSGHQAEPMLTIYLLLDRFANDEASPETCDLLLQLRGSWDAGTFNTKRNNLNLLLLTIVEKV